MGLEPVCQSRDERLIAGLRLLAAWPRLPLKDADAFPAHLVDQATAVLRVPRALLVWEEVDEPWLHLAHRSDRGLERAREAPLATPLVPAPLARASFLSDGRGETRYRCAPGDRGDGGDRREERWSGAPVDEGLARRFAIGAVASWPVRGELVEGRLFALDIGGGANLEGDLLVLGEIVALRLAAELDQYYLTRQVHTAAVTEERVRLACDLHDGMLQSLTGAALQLQALARLMAEDPAAAREQLAEIQRLIASDQRDLRFFIEELKPVPRALAGQADLRSRLEELSARLERLWGLRVDVHLEGIESRVSDALTRQLYRLLREALFNVARHAGASSVRIDVRRQAQGLSITVTDDGRGFPFHGRYEHEELARRKLGPVSLKERISALGGSLAIDSCPGLTRLEVNLPHGGGA